MTSLPSPASQVRELFEHEKAAKDAIIESLWPTYFETYSKRPFQWRKMWEAIENPDLRHIEMYYGTGKSRIALHTAFHKHLKTRTSGLVCIIFCRPRNLLSWREEIKKCAPTLHILEGEEGLETLLQYVPALSLGAMSVLLMPASKVPQREAALARLIRQLQPTALICDESTLIKNPNAQITKSLHVLAKEHVQSVQKSLRLTLTGRTCPEHPKEVWAQFQFDFPLSNPYGDTYYKFQHHWFLKGQYGYALRMDLTHKFYALGASKMLLLHTPQDLEEYKASLKANPLYVIEHYAPSAQQLRLLNALYETWSLPTDSDDPDATRTTVATPSLEHSTDSMEYSYTMQLLQKGQQIASGFYYDESGSPVYLKQQPKAELLQEIVKQLLEENPSRQIIVWHAYQAELPLILASLDKITEPGDVVVGPGEEALTKFALPLESVGTGAPPREPYPRIIIMPARVSQGHNALAWADTAIFYSTLYPQELRDQAEARNTASRQQHDSVRIIDLSSPLLPDHDVIAALQAKSCSSAKIMATVRSRFKEHKNGIGTK